MGTSVMAVLLFTAWTLVVVAIVLLWRSFEIARGVPANSWGRGAERDRPGLVKRAEHAHINCLENLPVFAAIVMAAVFSDKSAVTDGVAMWVVYARVLQSVMHLIGTSQWLVLLRATFYFVQVALFVYMIVGLL